jgi:hypothetical protein
MPLHGQRLQTLQIMPAAMTNFSGSLNAVNNSVVYKNDGSTGKLSLGMMGTTVNVSKVSCDKIKYVKIFKNVMNYFWYSPHIIFSDKMRKTKDSPNFIFIKK